MGLQEQSWVGVQEKTFSKWYDHIRFNVNPKTDSGICLG
jgi:hypothetical protein